MSTYQCSVCVYICDLNLKVIEKFQANKAVRLVVWHTGKVCTIHPQKFPEIHTGIFVRMESILNCLQSGSKVSLTNNIQRIFSASNQHKNNISQPGRKTRKHNQFPQNTTKSLIRKNKRALEKKEKKLTYSRKNKRTPAKIQCHVVCHHIVSKFHKY